ncbi:MAG: hypothetical protein ACRDQC_01780, partial [Gaiellales bacterium]
AARAALLSHDVARANAALSGLVATGVHSATVDARRAEIRAGVAALDGHDAEAHALYRDALKGHRDTGVEVEAALTAIQMATLLDPSDPDVRAAADAARELFTRLGAVPLLARLEAAVNRPTDGTGRPRRRSERASASPA